MRFLIFFFIFSFYSFSQKDELKLEVTDSLYREDQIYLSVTYNIIQNLPQGINSSKFSPGISFGFIRDMPINKNRDLSIGLGIGFSTSYYQNNLYIYDVTTDNQYSVRNYESISSDIYYDKNKLSLSYLEIPLEIRWRTSNSQNHKFWRFYSGFKVGYLIHDKYIFENDITTRVLRKNSDLNKFQLGYYFTVGWNSINIYAQYNFTPIFKFGNLEGTPIKINTLNLGFMFYIL